MENRRNLDIELIRIIACFFVIFNHTGENGFFLFSLQNRGSVPFWMDLMISILQIATFCGQQGRISRTIRAILSGQL